MPLGIRDITMVIRAKDNASRVFSQIAAGFGAMNGAAAAAVQKQMMAGAALMGIGAALGLIGVASLGVFNGMKNDAIEYDKQVALTMTQLNKVPATFEEIGDVGLRVAKEIPVPLEEMQQGLFDIFSSLDTTVSGAEKILTGFAKGAVAGQVELQEAGRATIGIMNAWRLPAEEINRVMDVQFKLVQVGVGTYGQFASTIGRAIPAAVASGNSIEDLAGMMAFLTRNGLSAAQSATSAARAMELVASPKTQEKMKKMGITFKDANGEFLSMREILHQLAYDKGWAKMTGPERKQAFQDLFGTGSIQARRFFDVAIPNLHELNNLTDQMFDSKGAMDEAYQTMFGRPATQSELLKNNIKALKIEIGRYFIPIAQKMTAAGLKMVKWFDGLSPGVKKATVFIAAFSAVIMTVAGVVTFVVGAFLLFSAAAAAVGMTLGSILAIIAGVTAAIVGLAAGGYAIIANWDTIKSTASDVWNAVDDYIQDAWDKMKDFGEYVKTGFLEVWNDLLGVGSRLKEEFGDWWDTTGTDAWERVKDSAEGLLETLGELPGNVREYAEEVTKDGLGKQILEDTKNLWKDIKDRASDAWDATKSGASTAWDKMQEFWDWFTTEWIDAWHGAQDQIDDFGNKIDEGKNKVEDFMDALGDTEAMKEWEDFGKKNTRYMNEFIAETEKAIVAVDHWAISMNGTEATVSGNIKGLPGQFAEMLRDIGSLLSSFEAPWDLAWKTTAGTLRRSWDDIKQVIEGGGTVIEFVMGALASIIPSIWNNIWVGMSGPVQLAFNGVVDFLNGATDAVWNSLLIPLYAIQGDWDKVWQSMGEGVRGAMSVIFGIIQIYTAMMWAPFALAWSIIVGIFSAGRVQVELLTQGLLDIIGGLFGLLFEIVTWPVRMTVQGVVTLWNWLYDVLVGHSIIPDLINSIATWFASLPGRVIGVIATLVSAVVNFFMDMFTRVVNTVSNGIQKVVSWFLSLGGRILGALPSPDLLYDFGARLLKGLINGIQSMLGSLQNIASQIAGVLSNISSGVGAVGGIVGGAAGVVGGLIGGRSVMPRSMMTPPVVIDRGGPRSGPTLNVERGAFEGAFPNVTDKEGIGEAVEEALMEIVFRLNAGTPNV